MKEIKFGLCTGCLERAEIDRDEFLQRLNDQLLADEDLKDIPPEGISWSIETYSCLRFCPEGRISVVAPRAEDPQQGRLGMSRSIQFADVYDCLVRDIKSHTKTLNDSKTKAEK
ncbi:hypothetical protein [Pseudobdellovibrio exovorus]|uniref:Uncharacterized protein n=1 Tax=Pseudobdellovibrio exovorus JSS TaxID=1184267 RepID=M4V803_9BACT|nr:hypothetical protein [Pseudobdellovibrio exovorus]AGH94565.1 hypothetical protein A11Q_345 [Pseudobdellovibrio exovorus JSS]